jgi:hypothetical protein
LNVILDGNQFLIDLKTESMLISILKKVGLAFLMIGIVVFLANVFRPENAIASGSGFTRIIPAVVYPFKMALGSATLFLIASFTLKPKNWKIVYLILLGINLIYLFYCVQTYVVIE